MIEVRAMKLNIDSIKRGDKNTLELNFALDLNTIEYYGDVIDLISPVNVNGRLYVIDDRLYLNLQVRTELSVNCSRCLESFTYPFKSSINAEFVHESLFNREEDEVDDDIIYYQEADIDLAELVKEHIIMNIPMKLVCNENCQGLCSSCGIKITDGSCNCDHDHIPSMEEDIDPRLAKLKELLQD